MSSAILESWEANALQWDAALSHQELESRILVTNQAIVDAVCQHSPTRVFDIGCGEGWLCRTLSAQGIFTLGADGTEALIKLACAKHPNGHYQHTTFEQLAQAAPSAIPKVDVFVINFSLYESLLAEQLLRQLHHQAQSGTRLVIQTLHPMVSLPSDKPYANQWMQEDWAGMPRPFSHPYRWYFRTLGSWISLLQQCGWQLTNLEEPLHPNTLKPASLLLTAKP
jgi:2-polyprenyl-3-methyl-5-hydroxy-6-metoxy-1,4-benzoquinol methylase